MERVIQVGVSFIMYVPFRLAELMIFGIAFVVPVLTLIGLVDVVRRPAVVWSAVGQNQLLWALIVVFVGFFGPLLYLVVAVPKLNGISSQDEAPKSAVHV